jgi:hypothetical protein
MVSRWRTCRGGRRSCRLWLSPAPQAPPTSSSGPRSVAWVPARRPNLSDQPRRSDSTDLDPLLPRVGIKMDENGMVVGRWLTDTRCYALTRVHTRFALSSGSLHKEISRHGLGYKQEQENGSNLFIVLRSWWREEVADHLILFLGPLLGFLLRLGPDGTGLGHDTFLPPTLMFWTVITLFIVHLTKLVLFFTLYNISYVFYWWKTPSRAHGLPHKGFFLAFSSKNRPCYQLDRTRILKHLHQRSQYSPDYKQIKL